MPKEWRFTQAQKEDLKTLSRTADKAYVRVRALALYHLAQGKTASEAAQVVLAHRVSIGAWARSYLALGPEGLKIAQGRGRPSSVDKQEIEKYLRQEPRTFGILRTRWTLTTLALVVPCLKGMSPPGVKKALTRCGFSYKRGQPHLHSPDPDYEGKKGQWS
jgi:transposase